jgi:hypothetical protein
MSQKQVLVHQPITATQLGPIPRKLTREKPEAIVKPVPTRTTADPVAPLQPRQETEVETLPGYYLG